MKYQIVFYIFLASILILRLFFFYSNTHKYQNLEKISFTTQILSSPKQYFNYQTIYVSIDDLEKVLIKTDLSREFNYGDYVKFSGTLKTLVLKNNSVIFTMNNPKIEPKSRENLSFLTNIYSLRQRIISNFKSNLDVKSSGLMLGIVFGIKDNLPKDFVNQIQITGVMHVIAASGMNVTMVSGFLFYLFALLFKRQVAVILSIIGILFYTALAGFEPSIVRAAIMGIIVFSAQIIGRQQYSFIALLITGFIMLFAFPKYLLDIGFQLSFVATLGLLYIPSLFKRFQNDFTEIIIVTVSAQLATLPILLINFGNYSIFSVLANTFVLWTVPILMILGSISTLFSFISTQAASFFLYLCLPFLLFFEKTVEFFAGFGSTFTLNSVPWQFGVAYYLLLLSLFVSRQKRA